MACDLCRRTLRGFLWYCWGRIWWPFTLWFAVGAWYRGNRSWWVRWLLNMYGNVRNPEWLSANERKWCTCRRGGSDG